MNKEEMIVAIVVALIIGAIFRDYFNYLEDKEK